MKKRSSKVRKKQASRRPPLAEPPCADLVKTLSHRKRQAKGKQELAFREQCLKAAVEVIALGMIPCLCWLFLAYNRPEFLEQILTFVACVAGGYGWARGKTKSGGGRCA